MLASSQGEVVHHLTHALNELIWAVCNNIHATTINS